MVRGFRSYRAFGFSFQGLGFKGVGGSGSEVTAVPICSGVPLGRLQQDYLKEILQRGPDRASAEDSSAATVCNSALLFTRLLPLPPCHGELPHSLWRQGYQLQEELAAPKARNVMQEKEGNGSTWPTARGCENGTGTSLSACLYMFWSI